MRIGIDYTAAARQQAGIGRYTRELVTSLLALDSDHDYVIFAAVGGLEPGRWEREAERLRAASAGRLTFHTLPLSDEWLARLWHRLRLPFPVEWLIGPVDVFYSPDFVLPPTRPDTRTLLTVHDLSFMRYPGAFVPPLRQYLERVVPRAMARADRVLADSAHTRDDIVAFFGVAPDAVTVLYSGVDPRFCPEPAPGERERLQARYAVDARPYVLSVGTLQPRKNYVRLIQAFGALQRPDTRLLIAGGQGWLYDKIIAAAARHERTTLLGFVDDADLPALYRHAELFVLPSLYEGFGLPVLEAMACGVPVVCSDTSSLPEVAGDAALLVDPLDVEALTEAMARALRDDERRETMIERGLAQAARFTWQRAARQLRDTIATLERG
jgi:glycosyltransferase involved in cell wall biosynthesis